MLWIIIRFFINLVGILFVTKQERVNRLLSYLGVFFMLGMLSIVLIYSQFFGRALVVITFGALLALTIYFIFSLYRGYLVMYIMRNRPFPPNRFTSGQWMEILERQNKNDQNTYLMRTEHQSLGLDAQEFLQVLCRIENAIKEEPALSTYWIKRDQLEQAFRQERVG